jgi:glycolate oxidase
MVDNKSILIQQLGKILPFESILSTDETITPYECDALTALKEKPLVVALPSTVEQAQKIIKVCYKLEIPVVTRGAGTGLSAGALPLKDGLLLVLAKLNKIINIDVDSCTATLQPGVRNLAISDAARPHGLYYAPDPSSQIACTIGGNVAENSGGVHCLKYGLTLHNVLQVKIITIEGEILTLGSSGLDCPGYDLLALIIGSEGMLAVIIEVTVKLLPVPPSVKVLLAAFNETSKAGEAVAAIIGAGIIPAGLEMMDKLAIKAAEDFIHAGYPTDAEAILLCEVDGTEQETEQLIKQITNIIKQYGAFNLQQAESEAERMTLWKGRKSAFPAVGRLAPDYYCMDGTIPRKSIGEVLHKITELSQQYQLPVANVFHSGDGNLHPLILYDANQPGELDKAEKLGGEILTLCVEKGGSITGEHGVGKEKLDQMCIQFQDKELEQFHAIKAAFDPKHLLNPGKAVPTLHRCAELGAMHVHNGELPFPDLPRF